jgi:hypothetical protein
LIFCWSSKQLCLAKRRWCCRRAQILHVWQCVHVVFPRHRSNWPCWWPPCSEPISC